MSTSGNGAGRHSDRVTADLVAEFFQALDEGDWPPIDSLGDRLRVAADVFSETLSRIGTLFLLSGIAGTMWALFQVAIQINTLDGDKKQVLLSLYEKGFTAFVVTLVGVTFGAVCFFLAQHSRTRLDEAIDDFLIKLRVQRTHFVRRRKRPEEHLADNLGERFDALAEVMEESRKLLADNRVGLDGLSNTMLTTLSPLGRFESVFSSLDSSVQQFTEFAHAQGDMNAMMADLRGSAEGLKDAAANLPQVYREHTNSAIGELKTFGNESHQTFDKISENVGDISSFVAEIPERLKSLFDKSLENYNIATREAFQVHVERLERIGATAQSQMPIVEDALSGVERRAHGTAAAVDDLAQRLEKSLKEVDRAAQGLKEHVLELRGAERRSLPGLRVALAVVALGAMGVAGFFLLGTPQEVPLPPPLAVGEHVLLATAPGRFATMSVRGAITQASVGAAVGAEGYIRSIGEDFVLVRSGTKDVVLRRADAPGATLAPQNESAADLSLLAILQDPSSSILDRLNALDNLPTVSERCGTSIEKPLALAFAAELLSDVSLLARRAADRLGTEGCRESAAAIAAPLTLAILARAEARGGVLSGLLSAERCAVVRWQAIAAQMDQASLIGRRAFVDMAAKCNFPDPLSASVSRHCAQRANRSASACKRLTGHAAAAKRAATAKQASIGSR